VDNLGALLSWLASLPFIDRFVAWLVSLPSLTFPQLFDEVVETFLKLLGLRELIKYVYRFALRKKSRLVHQIEILEEELGEKKRELSKVEARTVVLDRTLNEMRSRLPELAIARAEAEWRDRNEEKGIRQLDEWFRNNSSHLAQIALHLAKFHISRSVPDPREHLEEARRLIQLATAAAPNNSEIRGLWREFDLVNGALQEQMILAGESRIVWNSNMSQRGGAPAGSLLAILTTFRDIATYCVQTGK
jgi:hypothetical protein